MKPLPVTEKALRAAFGCFATGVAIMTTLNEAREPIGLTVSSFSSASLSPPLLLFSINRQARCLAVFAEAEYLAVNILSDEQAELSRTFAMPGADRWRDTNWISGRFGSPLIDDALAWFECGRYRTFESGDHLIFVCSILHFDVGDADGEPLLCWRGRYHKIAPHPAQSDHRSQAVRTA
jgi:flavin reductase (DIM6/NTAB) family NADH-FMN oxidoreductase RutF